MRRLTVISVLILSLMLVSLIAVTAVDFRSTDYVSRGGPARITHYDPRVNWGGPLEAGRLNTIAYLEPYEFDKGKGVGRGGYDPIYPRGTVRISSSAYYGYPKGSVVINVKDIPATEDVNAAYEAWLVDEDTGYRLSLGTFIALKGGVGELKQMTSNYLNVYDTVEITAEPLNDLDPLPGPIVLIGTIPRSHIFFNPEPKQTMLVTESIENY